MASGDWVYDRGARRYRSTSTGRFVSQATMVKLRNDFIDGQRGRMDALVKRLTNHDITVQAFEHAARDIVKEVNGAQYIFGRGGRNAMTQADYGRTGAIVKAQYAYLHDFAAAIAASELSEAQIATRAQMYVSSGVAAYERGRGAAFGLSLPAHPGDGSSICLANDRCSWDIQETEEEYRATWVLSSANPCSTCSGRAAQWAPMIVSKVAA